MSAFSLADSRVLIVDDNEFNRKTLAVVLNRANITQVEFAANGEEGLVKVETFKPDLILLDVGMPVMDGLEMCRRLRDDPRHGELPILFQTIWDGDSEQVKCFAAGGSDLISKPIRPGECVARVRHHLEKRRLFQQLNAFSDRLRQELSHARSMQLSLLPEAAKLDDIARRHGVVINGHFETSSELGGDFWQAFDIDDDRVAVLIADFTGHGITAAINTFRMHTLIGRLGVAALGGDEPSPAAWLSALGAALKEVLPVGQFATAFLGVIDTRTDRMIFSGAGAPPPILVVDGEPRQLDSSGLALGIARDGHHQNREAPFPPGARLFAHSDALTETPDEFGITIGFGNVPPLVAWALSARPADPMRAILDEFLAHRPRPLRDDLTALWIERRS